MSTLMLNGQSLLWYHVNVLGWIIEAASRPCFEDIASELDTLKRDPARYVLTAYVRTPNVLNVCTSAG
jgi:hypothetical protein